MSPRVSHVIAMRPRPRQLRRRLLLIGLGAVLAAFTLSVGVAKADPVSIPEAICEVLDADSSDARFQRIYDVLIYEVKLSDAEAGDAIANSVLYRCPQHRAALLRFADAAVALV